MNEIMCKGKADNIPVYCAFDKIEKIENVRPNPKNPNQHPEDQIELLSKIILAQGLAGSGYGVCLIRSGGARPRAFDGRRSVLGCRRSLLTTSTIRTRKMNWPTCWRTTKSRNCPKSTRRCWLTFRGHCTDSIDLTGYSQQEVQEINDALSEAVMMDIDDIKSKSEVSTHKMKIDRTVVELTDEEYDMLMSELDKYTDINGTTFGFVRWLLNDD